MITIRVNLNGLDKKFREAPKKLQQKIYDRVKAKTSQIKRKAQRMAPKQSGALSRSIYGRTYKTPLRASIGIYGSLRGRTTGFPYASFVTGQTPITIGSGYNRYFGVRQTVMYGEPAKSPIGAPISWTAEPGWWQVIETTARYSYPATVSRAVKDFTKEMNKA